MIGENMETNELIKKWADKVIASNNAKYIYDFSASMNGEISDEVVQKLTEAIVKTYSSFYDSNEKNKYIYDFISDIDGVSFDYIIERFGDTIPIEFFINTAENFPNAPIDKISDIIIKRGNYSDIVQFIQKCENVPTDNLIAAFMEKPDNEYALFYMGKIECMSYFVNHNIGDINIFTDYIIKNGKDAEIFEFIKECNKLLNEEMINKLVDALMTADDDNSYVSDLRYSQDQHGKYAYILELADKKIGDIGKYFDIIINSHDAKNIIELARITKWDNLPIIFTSLVHAVEKFDNLDDINMMASVVDSCRDNSLKFMLLDKISNTLAQYDDQSKLSFSKHQLADSISYFIRTYNFLNDNIVNKLLELNQTMKIVEVGIYFCYCSNSSQLVNYIEKCAKAVVNSGNIEAMYNFLINSKGYAINILMDGIMSSKNVFYIDNAQKYLDENNISYNTSQQLAYDFMEFMLDEQNQDKTVGEATLEFNKSNGKKVKKLTKK